MPQEDVNEPAVCPVPGGDNWTNGMAEKSQLTLRRAIEKSTLGPALGRCAVEAIERAERRRTERPRAVAPA